MRQITLDELYNGNKYGLKDRVVEALEAKTISNNTEDFDLHRNIEIVRQTLIVAREIIENGDCVVDDEVDDAITIFNYHEQTKIRGFIEAYPGIEDRYLKRAYLRMEKDGCPNNENSWEWLGKLITEEIIKSVEK